jgi:hypothetical protein
MFPPKIHLTPTFWKLVPNLAYFTDNPQLGMKVKNEAQIGGELGMILQISLIFEKQLTISPTRFLFQLGTDFHFHFLV